MTGQRRPWWWRWAWAFATPLALAACVARQPVVPPVPGPMPTPSPRPEPTPQPHPDARRLTEAEVMALPLGATEADVYARLGQPFSVVDLRSRPGTRALVYSASTAGDPTRRAEVWIRDGRVVNRFVY